MSSSVLRDVLARLATEPALAAELDADPDAFGHRHRLTVDEVATLRSLRRPGTAAGGPVKLRERLSRSGMGFGGSLGALAQDVDLDSAGSETPPDDAEEGGDGAVDARPERGPRTEPRPEARSAPETSAPPLPEGRSEAELVPEPRASDGGAAPESLPGGAGGQAEGATPGPETPRAEGGEQPTPAPEIPPVGDGTTGEVEDIEAPGTPEESEGDSEGPADNDSLPLPPSPPPAPIRLEDVGEPPPEPIGTPKDEQPTPPWSSRQCYPNGITVERDERSGLERTTYLDGSYVEASGLGTSYHRADGVIIGRRPNGVVDSILYPDGTEMRGDASGQMWSHRWEPDGRLRQVMAGPDGTVQTSWSEVVNGLRGDPSGEPPATELRRELPPPPTGDPTSIVSDGATGKVTTTYPDGTAITADVQGNITTTYRDGTIVMRSEDGGAITRRLNPDGTFHIVQRDKDGNVHEFDERIVDGVLQRVDPANRPGAFAELPPSPAGVPTSVTQGADGSVTRTYPGATVTTWPDGSARADYGPDGVVERTAEGNVLHRRHGEVLIVRPDGSSLLGTPRGDGSTFLVVPRDAQGRPGEAFVGRPDGRGGYTPVEQERRGDRDPDDRRDGPDPDRHRPDSVDPGARRPGPVVPIPPGAPVDPGGAGTGAPGGSLVAPGPGTGSPSPQLPLPELPDLPAGATIAELPGGGRLIRYADGATSTVTPNPDGSVHVVDRDPAGRVVHTYDTAPHPVPDDQPVSLLQAGAVTVAAGAVSTAAVAAVLHARRMRTAGREE